jgi:hypothetical protein
MPWPPRHRAGCQTISPDGDDRADVRRWIADFEAAAAVDREARCRRGPDMSWSIGVALSLISAVEAAGRRPDDAASLTGGHIMVTMWPH